MGDRAPLRKWRRVRVSFDLIESLLRRGTKEADPEDVPGDLRIVRVGWSPGSTIIELVVASDEFDAVRTNALPTWEPKFVARGRVGHIPGRGIDLPPPILPSRSWRTPIPAPPEGIVSDPTIPPDAD